MGMKVVTLTRGGQISIPAEYRRDWTSNRVIVRETDEGLLLTPMPADPLAAAAGSLKHLLAGRTADEVMREYREENREIEARRSGDDGRP